MRNDAQQPTYTAWPQGVREVPDMLVAAQLSLGPLAKGETMPTSDEARRMVGDACDLLTVALTHLAGVTRSLPGFPLGAAVAANPVDARRDPRMSLPSDDPTSGIPRPAEECALTRRLEARSDNSAPFTPLTAEQLDRLRRCANGNTLRFESSDIVAALVAAGYATEGVGCVVTVTANGHRYLEMHPS